MDGASSGVPPRRTEREYRAGTARLEDEREEFERRLDAALPRAEAAPQRLHRALRYSAQSGGKRLRPLLCRAAAQAVAGQAVEAAWAPAVALELIHTYSLIHDDLPALDNDALRRGRPTCHVAFDEATAILAGDGLLTLAFEVLTEAPLAPAAVAAMVRELARAAGTPGGMVAGQAADLEATSASATLEEVGWIHARKTAALIRASLVLGGVAAGASAARLAVLGDVGEAAGLAFQIVDDLLDRSGSTAELGKTAGKDEAQAKATYPAAAGVAAAEAQARELAARARALLADWGVAADPLRRLTDLMVERRR